MVKKRRVVIMGAQGRDYHNFNVFFRKNRKYEVVAFTVEQIQMKNRIYPKILAGRMYPKGIPIFNEKSLPKLIKEYKIDEVVLAYSDLFHEEVMQKASLVLSCGADFKLMGPKQTMLESKRPVIAITGVRTGTGKSPTSRKVCRILKSYGINFVVVRHPMPYGNLEEMIVQRFSSKSDLEKYNSTIEEREEYEPHLDEGNIVYAGVDFEKILKQAEKEADLLVWDGGNNDLPFIEPDLHIVVADARRPGHELMYYPGETNVRMADVVIVNKVGTANQLHVQQVIDNVKSINKKAVIIKAAMDRFVDRPELIRGKRVLIVEDGPTLTHGGLGYGAGMIEAKSLGAFIISPRSKAVGSIRDVFVKYPHLGTVLPAMGYSRKQMEELQETINNVDCDSVLIGTPVDLRNLLNINKPAARVRYEIREIGKPNLEDVLRRFLRKI
ncbi:MAG: GTPase [Candidatus Aenigmarchaeota archaeon]|nr:GTPase [Candidatus Aenigmarchaeota archaeon]